MRYILGDGASVEQVLAQSQEAMERRYTVQAEGVDLDYIADLIARLLGMTRRQVWLPGKYQQQVTARSLLCFWAVRELGLSIMIERFFHRLGAGGKQKRKGPTCKLAESDPFNFYKTHKK